MSTANKPAPGQIPPVVYTKEYLERIAAKKAEQAARGVVSWRKPYPIDALGEVAGAAVRAIAHNVQCPPELAANSILACASVAAQAVANVQLGHGGRPRPLSLHIITAAESGDRKTSADNEATTAIREREVELAKEHAVASGEYRAKSKAWTIQEARITKTTEDYEELQRLLIAHGKAKPAAPLGPMLTFDKGTVQGISKAFRSQQPAQGLLNNDAAAFVAGHAFKDENAAESGATLSAFWDGQDISSLLAGDGLIQVLGKRLAIHGMVQPGVARTFLCSETLTDQGYIARCLIAWPESKIGNRPELHPDTYLGILHDEAGAVTHSATVGELRRPQGGHQSLRRSPRRSAEGQPGAVGREYRLPPADPIGGGERPSPGVLQQDRGGLSQGRHVPSGAGKRLQGQRASPPDRGHAAAA
jgi:uncharacterized protein DUF3987